MNRFITPEVNLAVEEEMFKEKGVLLPARTTEKTG